MNTPPSDPSKRGTRLLLELGRGGMGVVYLALSVGPGGFVKLKVLKRLRAELADEPRARQMFLDEAKLAARLHHPNIVQTNEVGFDGKHYFMEMEYLEGQSLDAMLKRADLTGTTIPLEVELWMLTQTLAGLHHAHELQDLDGKPLRVVHRDVSPHNVFVTYDGQVKVLDFGIAKAADSRDETTTGAIKGKVTYMSPEQADKRPLDRRTDVFAVGIILWQFLVGRRLWGDKSDFAIVVALADGDIPSPRSLRPEVPAALDAVCTRALAHDPEGRFATAADMQAAIEEYLESTGARVGPRDAAKIMNELFAEKRARVKAEIEEQMRSSAPEGRTIDVPVLGDAPTPAPEPSAASVPSKATARTRLRRMTLAAAAVAVIAAAGTVGMIATKRGTSSTSPGAASSVSAATVATAAECKTSHECVAAHGGKPWICRGDTGKCVALESEDCRVLASPEDVENDKTVWFGTMYPTTGPKAEIGAIVERGVDLGRRDFVQITHGLPSLAFGDPVRPVGLVACNDANDPARAAHHLADDLHVPAVLGFGSSQEVVDLSTQVFAPQHILVVASENRSTMLRSIPRAPGDPRLVFLTAPAEDLCSAPVSLVVPQLLEPRVVKAGTAGPQDAMRVALIRSDSTADLNVADQIFAGLRFNGKSALENGDKFRQFVFTNLDRTADSDAALVQFRPHVIIFSGAGEMVGPIIEPVERGWRKDVKYRPYWVSNSSLVGDDLFKFIGTSVERRRRFLGIGPAATTLANARLAMRYNEVFPEKITPAETPAASYDAFYLLAYAGVASSARTGPELASAIGKLVPPGAPIDVGPTQILQGVDALRTAGRFDLGGIETRLDFDFETGESKADLVITCIGVDEAGRANDGMDSGVRYDSKTGTLVGNLNCP